MRPKSITLTMATADRNGICAAQTPVGAGNFTIDGALATGGVATMDVPRHVSFYSDGDESGDTYTITGTDRYGKALTETVTGPNTTTVYSTKNFKTITQVATSGAGTGNIEVGSGNQLESQLIPIDSYAEKISVACTLSVSASLTYNIYHTLSNIFASGFTEDDAVYHDNFGAFIANTDEVTDGPVTGVRIGVSSFSSGTLTIRILTQKNN